MATAVHAQDLGVGVATVDQGSQVSCVTPASTASLAYHPMAVKVREYGPEKRLFAR
jgi:hypothetical protein